MKIFFLNIAIIFIFLISFETAAQEAKDKAIFVKPEHGFFFNEILKDTKEFNKKEKEDRKIFRMDFTGLDLPKSVDEFKAAWYNPPISQGLTGTCWDFSTTSFFESEIYRIHNKKIKLSELYTVYWEYVEKAKRFIEERGNSVFGEGSEANAVTRIWEKYGIIPEKDFTGLKPGQKFHDHSKMYAEMNDYLQKLKQNNAWNEEEAISTIKSIMNHYIGTPPSKVTLDGTEYTPKEYLAKVVDLNLNDYVDVMSLMEEPYWQKVEYKVSDNWWHSKDYYNVPLDVFMKILKDAVRKGYTTVIGGDVSEPGYVGKEDVAIVPSFDIPSRYIDENARQFRFSNHTTTDDHGIHLVGFENKNGKDWYLIKDSAAGSRDGNNKGYYFYNEDYVKLKIMDFMIHKDALGDYLKKFD